MKSFESLHLKSFEIWSEGYSATGELGRAVLHGYQVAETFQDACDRFFADSGHYSSEALTYWGCRLFDNEKDARRSFG